jgi:hypothetical protein
LEIGFETKTLRRLCEQQAHARRELGDDPAAALLGRLADLEAADSVVDLPWLSVVFGTHGEASIEFFPGYHLNVLAISGVSRMKKISDTDWSTVDRLRILGVTKS